MKISIFGLGYVGVVSAACFAKDGHTVIGVDPVDVKVNMINRGESPIIEKDIGEIIKFVVENGKLKATTNALEAIENSELSLVCVGTPSKINGDLDTSYVQRVCEHIGAAIKNKIQRHVVVIRSTIIPGTIKNIVIPTLEASSGKIAGQDFGVCNNPEFLREGTAVYDFYNPPKTVIGETDVVSGDLLASIYQNLDCPVIRTAIEVAEMVKYVDNVWHALKVGFGNEVGNICKSLGVDSHDVMDIFCSDTKLNISPCYLKPGFAFGGSCLPKDVRALAYKGKSLDINLPILNSILPSNDLHIENGLRMVMEDDNRQIGFLGFSFKAGTDDLRESPVVEMIERLLGKGYEIKLYDKNVNLAALVGANKAFILNKIPHIAKLMVKTMNEVLEHAQTIVIGNNSFEFKNIMDNLREDQKVIDLVRAVDGINSNGFYKGLCW
ncbi:nucleotide sugar dehydrogenase [Desulfobacula phenolica]|uniref:UDP-glucose 6-dehydrogenase n=1 Tax=Desulfobacula phenolica TaxID=90732 RepID=A0A1H2DTQ8_9BACT|nr:nucleotide sugar dehydrogenase [Desulfobacula phenolica]SDT86259.1 GDP-mannose 6-dehydrogenase [Desulfobacula phenolica]